MTHWIVVQTRPKCEHLAEHHLKRQGYGVYLPLVTRAPDPNPVPFFPRYIFADVEPREGLWRPIEGTIGVSSVLKTSERPSRISEKIIGLMRDREQAGVIRLRAIEKAAEFEPGEALRINEGSFSGFTGVFERLSGPDGVRVMLSFMGKRIPADIPAELVEKVA